MQLIRLDMNTYCPVCMIGGSLLPTGKRDTTNLVRTGPFFSVLKKCDDTCIFQVYKLRTWHNQDDLLYVKLVMWVVQNEGVVSVFDVRRTMLPLRSLRCDWALNN